MPVRRLPREDFAFLLQQRDAARYRVSGKALARVSALFAGRSLPGAKAGRDLRSPRMSRRASTCGSWL